MVIKCKVNLLATKIPDKSASKNKFLIESALTDMNPLEVSS